MLYFADSESLKLSEKHENPAETAVFKLFQRGLLMVETAGIEPASESVSSEPSPGADGYCGPGPGSPHRAQAVTRVGSGSFIMRAALKALRGHGRH